MLKYKLKKVAAIVACFIGLINHSAWADDNEQLIKKLTERTAALESEIGSLKAELRQLKPHNIHAKKRTARQATSQTLPEQTAVKADIVTLSPNEGKQNISHHNLPAAPGIGNVNVSQLATMPAILFFGGTPVVTAPYIGVRSQFDASDLIVNIPSVNQDLRLLVQWDKLEEEYAKYGVSAPERPFIDLSGKVEAQALTGRPYIGRKASDIDVSSLEFDIAARVTSWAGAFISFKYDNNQTTPQRSANSRVFVNKAFVTAGDLDRFPAYVTIGQAYVPFGLYLSNMISPPLTQSLARTRARYLQVGYSKPDNAGIYGSVYTFKGDSATSMPSNRINQAGVNAGYKYNGVTFHTDIGGGYIANIADADGFQATGGALPGFSGFGATTASEALKHQVPGADIHASVGFGSYSLVGEYITATRPFALSNLMFNGHGAKPQAVNVEGAYSFHVLNKPTSISLGYQQTMQALALLLPERRYTAAINTSIWKSTIEGLEFRHDINYGAALVASGQALPVITAGGLGKTADTLTAQIGVYF